jgi:hypothetical protein
MKAPVGDEESPDQQCKIVDQQCKIVDQQCKIVEQ